MSSSQILTSFQTIHSINYDEPPFRSTQSSALLNIIARTARLVV